MARQVGHDFSRLAAVAVGRQARRPATDRDLQRIAHTGPVRGRASGYVDPTATLSDGEGHGDRSPTAPIGAVGATLPSVIKLAHIGCSVSAVGAARASRGRARRRSASARTGSLEPVRGTGADAGLRIV